MYGFRRKLAPVGDGAGGSVAGRYDGEGKTLGGCSRPGQVLDLKNWKITLPVDDPDQPGEQPLDVVQPQLNRYVLPPWFVVARGCHGVQFRNAVNGMHTPNSRYARSELREMTNNGTTGRTGLRPPAHTRW